jgi:hypothetical protein
MSQKNNNTKHLSKQTYKYKNKHSTHQTHLATSTTPSTPPNALPHPTHQVSTQRLHHLEGDQLADLGGGGAGDDVVQTDQRHVEEVLRGGGNKMIKLDLCSNR